MLKTMLDKLEEKSNEPDAAMQVVRENIGELADAVARNNGLVKND